VPRTSKWELKQERLTKVVVFVAVHLSVALTLNENIANVRNGKWGRSLLRESRQLSWSSCSMAAGWLLCAGEDERDWKDWKRSLTHVAPSACQALIAKLTSPLTGRSKQRKGLKVGFRVPPALP
jgi:hypothetical protein